MDRPYREPDAADSRADRTAWGLLLAGGSAGGALICQMTYPDALGLVIRISVAVFGAVAGAGLTALGTRLFFSGPDSSITIARRYRQWKPLWAALLLAVGVCCGAGALLGVQGLGMYVSSQITSGDASEKRRFERSEKKGSRPFKQGSRPLFLRPL